MDVGEMQRKLSQWATENPEDQYRDLYSLLCHALWMQTAWKIYRYSAPFATERRPRLI